MDSLLKEAVEEENSHLITGKYHWSLVDLEEKLPDLDLIIDLTATERYYNPDNLSR